MNPEPTFLGAFKENPTFFALAVLLGAAGFALVLVALVVLRTSPVVAAGLGLAGALAGLLTMAAGAIGYASARAHTDAACSSPGLAARDRERLVAYGYAEATMPLELGVALGAIPLLGGGALGIVGIAMERKRRSG